MPVMAQKKYLINVAALDVDGAPKITNSVYNTNPNSPDEVGSKQISAVVAQQSWDIVGVSSDYYYHEELVSAISQDYNNTGKPGNEDFSGYSSRNSSNDGLALLYSQYAVTAVSQSSDTDWSSYYNGNSGVLGSRYYQDIDGYTKKGYRLYAVTLTDGVVLDVYVLTMDEGSTSSDVSARNNQLTQLANAIKNNKNGRPMIVMGTTNSLYTREQVKKNLVDAVNNNSSGLVMKDAWVEVVRGGKYPEYGTEDEIAGTGYFDMRSGEAYNKIFFINNSNSAVTIEPLTYERLSSLSYLDHMPVVVGFIVTDANGTPSENDWAVDVPQNVTSPDGEVWGQAFAAGTDTEYYIKNVATGLYLKSGATWGTQACEGSAGMPIKIGAANKGKYVLYTNSTKTLSMSNKDDYPYMDNNENTQWYLVEAADDNGKKRYYLKRQNDNSGSDMALSSIGGAPNVDHAVYCKPFDANDEKQMWVFLTADQMKTEMAAAASVANPYDATPLMKAAASIDRMDIDILGTAATSWPGFSFNCLYDGSSATHNGIASYVNTGAKNLPFTMKNMPAGYYQVSFEGFYRARATNEGLIIDYNTSDYSWGITVSLTGGTLVPVRQNSNITFDDYNSAVTLFRDGDEYRTLVDGYLSKNSDLTLTIDIKAFTEGDANRAAWLALDNFVIKYLGNTSVKDQVKKLVGDYINAMAVKVGELNSAGQAAYDISAVLARYNANPHRLSIDGSVEIAMIDAAYEIALAAHHAEMNSQTSLSGLIVNPSFETGDMTGWTQEPIVGEWMDSKCMTNGNGMDGTYCFNSWREKPVVTPIKQTVKGLKNGLYQLSAVVASDPGNTVYLIGNNYHKGTVILPSQTHEDFVSATLLFLVEDGTATIGAVGGYNGYYYPTGGFYRVDNFQLEYICDLTNGRVKLALDEAKSVAATFDVAGQNAWNSSSIFNKYQAYLNGGNTSPNVTTSADQGITESKDVYDALTAAALKQTAIGSDMTWCLGDPSFELGKYKSVWTTTAGWETTVAKQNDMDFAAVGVQGNYLFNTWNNHSDATNSGVNAPVKKTINGLPNGTYRLTAKVASDAGNTIFLFGNNTTASVVARNLTSGGVTNKTETAAGEITITPSGITTTKSDNYGQFTCQTSSTYNSSRLELGQNGSVTISASGLDGNDVVITSVELTYRARTGSWSYTYYYGNSVTASPGKVGNPTVTSGNSKGTITISDVNAATLTVTNGPDKRALHITSIKVNYQRSYNVETEAGDVLLEAKRNMREVSVDFEVTNGTATVGVVGGKDGVYNANGGCWYKVDDFNLKLLFSNTPGGTLYLSENATCMPDIDFEQTNARSYNNVYNYSKVVVQRTINSGSWSTLVLPFNLPFSQLGNGWDVRELAEARWDAEKNDVVVTFAQPTEKIIKAGKCYIVRHDSQNLSEIGVDVESDTKFVTLENTLDNSGQSTGDGGTVEFVGTYTSTYVPLGAYFVNTKNQFKKVVKPNTNKIKGFRGYFVVKDGESGVRSLSLRIGENTGVDSVNNGEATIVAIYNLKGMRLNDMEPGINILQMSDGTSMKVIIK